ncbi:methyl-accepting chemotaxis protein [Tumebacillus flagellatus]|uniref:Chemotaxis protein n=1 Tax=Tumebacillus flagellatus TaxID=1157490 RepID=A0A074M8X0_9BACL|nr:methyl-accepting chemotaxis protein [Tumebacillus flagellatus]KEO82412.1 hypothetical protein EL26_15135 [Tumebacillus flagellatus]
MKFRSFSIRTKLLVLIVLILVPSFAALGYMDLKRVGNAIVGESIVKAKSDMQTGYALLESQYPGAWSVRNGELYKGDISMNGNNDFVDAFAKLTGGDTVSLFLGDVRVATTSMKDKKRTFGTKAAADVVQTTLVKGEVYSGEADVLDTVFQTAYLPLRDDSGKIIGMWGVGSPSLDDRIAVHEQAVKRDILITAVIVLAIAFVLSFWFVNRITKRIRAVAGTIESVAGGNLALPELNAGTDDEVGAMTRSMNRMVQDLRSMMSQVRDASWQVAASSEELNASAEQTNRATELIVGAIQDIAAGTEHQVSIVEDGRHVLQEINNRIENITKSTEIAAERANDASAIAESGNQAIQSALDQMTSISQTITELAAVIEGLGESSKYIGKIVETITGIAGQTNLLALNAAIESARAGEHGRGFSVVANEVRMLAEQSTDSAKQIGEYIHRIQESIAHAVQGMESSIREVRAGENVVFVAGESFSQIQQSITLVAKSIKEVSVEAREMVASTQLSDAMRKIAEVAESSSTGTQYVSASTEEQLATMEEVYASSTSLSQMAEELQRLVGKFQLKS